MAPSFKKTKGKEYPPGDVKGTRAEAEIDAQIEVVKGKLTSTMAESFAEKRLAEARRGKLSDVELSEWYLDAKARLKETVQTWLAGKTATRRECLQSRAFQAMDEKFW